MPGKPSGLFPISTFFAWKDPLKPDRYRPKGLQNPRNVELTDDMALGTDRLKPRSIPGKSFSLSFSLRVPFGDLIAFLRM